MYATASLIILLSCVIYSLIEEYRVKREYASEVDQAYWVSVFLRSLVLVFAMMLMVYAAIGHRVPAAPYAPTKTKVVCNHENKCKLEQERPWYESLP